MNSRAKVGAIIMALLTLLYTALLANTGFTLLLLDEPVAKAMGFALLCDDNTLGIGIFGVKIDRFATKVESQGKWPHFAFELRPSGRPTRESADRVFESFAKNAEQNPESSLAWFSLGLAYDAAGDRPRARKAMRKALALDAKA